MKNGESFHSYVSHYQRVDENCDQTAGPFHGQVGFIKDSPNLRSGAAGQWQALSTTQQLNGPGSAGSEDVKKYLSDDQKNVVNPINNGRNHLSTGAGFLPSTVVPQSPSHSTTMTGDHANHIIPKMVVYPIIINN